MFVNSFLYRTPLVAASEILGNFLKSYQDLMAMIHLVIFYLVEKNTVMSLEMKVVGQL